MNVQDNPGPNQDSVLNKYPVLSYDVPQPNSYSGENITELLISDANGTSVNWWKPINPQEGGSTPQQKRRATLKNGLGLLPWLGQITGSNGVRNDLRRGINLSTNVDANLRFGDIRLAIVDGRDKMVTTSNIPLDSTLKNLHIPEVENYISQGYKMNIYTSLAGNLRHNYYKPVFTVLERPRLFLVEKYRMSSYIGNYGIGRVIKTSNMLPGQESSIRIKTYRSNQTTSSKSESILDSFSESSANNFEDSIMNEESYKVSRDERFEYHSEAEAKATWGWGSAKVSGGVAGGTNKSREEFGKNVQTATSKHANEASSNRNLEVESSIENTTTQSREREATREFENINVGKTLNFVFRQMNQEFISILHLIDIRVSYVFKDKREEFALHDLEDFVFKYVAEEHKELIIKTILQEVLNIFDYKGKPAQGYEVGNNTPVDFVQKMPKSRNQVVRSNDQLIDLLSSINGISEILAQKIVTELKVEGLKISINNDDTKTLQSVNGVGEELGKKLIENEFKEKFNDIFRNGFTYFEGTELEEHYFRFRGDVYSKYLDVNNREINVPGIIINLSKNVLRTDGIIADAFLGVGNALDNYSSTLQQETNRKLILENDMAEKKMDRENIINEIIKTYDNNEAKEKGEFVIKLKYPPCCPENKEKTADSK